MLLISKTPESPTAHHSDRRSRNIGIGRYEAGVGNELEKKMREDEER